MAMIITFLKFFVSVQVIEIIEFICVLNRFLH